MKNFIYLFSKYKISVIIFFLIFTFTSCKNQGKDEFNLSKKENTVSAYQSFIKKYPSSSFSDSAKYYIEKIEYKNLQFINKTEAYENYIIKYPSSEFIDSIKSKIYLLEYNQVKKNKSVSLANQYIKNYPLSPFKTDVEKLIKKLKYGFSDKGLKSKVISTIRRNMTRKCSKNTSLKVSVKNGNVTINFDCLEYAKCESSMNYKVIGWHRGCKNWMKNEVKPNVARIKGVKSIYLNNN